MQFQIDTQGRDLELRYFRDVDGREVDFVVVEKRKPILLVKAKSGDADVVNGLRYLDSGTPAPAGLCGRGPEYR